MTPKQSKLKDLEQKREYWRTKVFWLLIEIAFIFGIPAALGVLVGSWIKREFGFGNEALVVILSATFIFSWVIIVIRYRQVKKNLDRIEDEIGRHKERHGQ